MVSGGHGPDFSELTESRGIVKGEVYYAVAVGARFLGVQVLVKASYGRPIWCPLALFDVLEGAVPPHWSMVVHEPAGTMGVPWSWRSGYWAWHMGYVEMVESLEHHDSIVGQLDHVALAIFRRELDLVKAFHDE